MTRPSGARWSSVDRRSASHTRSVTSNTASSRFEAVSSGPMRRKLSGLARITSRRKAPEHARRLARGRAGQRVPPDGVVAEVGQLEVAQQQPAVGVRVRAHPPLAGRRERGQLVTAARRRLVEQLLGTVGAQPRLELGQVLGLVADVGQRHLVGAERALGGEPVDDLGTGPALRRAQHDHRPARPRRDRPPRGLAAGSRRSPRTTSSSVAAISWCIVAGSSPSTKRGA